MGGFMIAWLLGEGIVIWRWGKAGAPPTPGALALSSGFFALLGIVGSAYPPSRGAMTALAFGVDIAALIQVLPGSTVQQNTGWPPPTISDPTVLLPTGNAHGGGAASETPGGNPSNTPGAVGGANNANGAPPGTPPNPGLPPTGPGTIYPPGSQNLLWRHQHHRPRPAGAAPRRSTPRWSIPGSPLPRPSARWPTRSLNPR